MYTLGDILALPCGAESLVGVLGFSTSFPEPSPAP